MLSVVIPAFQAERTLPEVFRALDCEPDCEVIVVDDGSSDSTAAVSSAWLSQRTSGKFVKLKNSGPGIARQTGLELATRPFLTFVDADDEVNVSVLIQAAKMLHDIQGDVVITNFSSSQEPLSRDMTRTLLSKDLKLQRVPSSRVLRSRATVWGKVYRREFLTRHGIEFGTQRVAEDVIFSWELASRRPKTYVLDAVAYRYVVAPHGQLTNTSNYSETALQSLGALWARSKGYGFRARLLATYAAATGLGFLLRRGTFEERMRLLTLSLRRRTWTTWGGPA